MRQKRKGLLFIGKAVDDPSDSVPHECLAEVEQKPEFESGQRQIGEHLLLVCAAHGLNRLQFQDDLALNDEIRAESLVNADPLILD